MGKTLVNGVLFTKFANFLPRTVHVYYYFNIATYTHIEISIYVCEMSCNVVVHLNHTQVCCIAYFL